MRVLEHVYMLLVHVLDMVQMAYPYFCYGHKNLFSQTTCPIRIKLCMRTMRPTHVVLHVWIRLFQSGWRQSTPESGIFLDCWTKLMKL